MIRRIASLSGAGMMVGLLCSLPLVVGNILEVVRQGEPVRWVIPPWDLPGSYPLAVTSHLATPLVIGVALGLLAGLVGLLPVAARIPRWFRYAGLLMLGIVPVMLLTVLTISFFVGKSLEQPAETQAGSSTASRPNLVLIYIDTLRRDHLSCYGRERFSTPSIDQLAADAVQFQRATSPASHTVPAVCSVMTCRYPGGNTGLARGRPYQLPPGSPTLAGHLRAAGYRTAAFIGNYVLGRDYNTRIWQGFEVFDDRFPQREAERLIPEREAGPLGRAAVSWLRANRDQCFFLWLHFQDPHGPYTPPAGTALPTGPDDYGPPRSAVLASGNFKRGGIPAYQQLEGGSDPRHYLAGYDGEIAHVDLQVGLVLAWLRKLELQRNTVVVLLSDHGEAMEDDHGWYFSHGHDLTEDQVRVPLLIRLPGGGESLVIRQEVSTIDLYPTLLGLAGVEIPPGLSGRDLLSLPDGPDEEGVVLTFTGGGIRAVRSGPWKLILRGGREFLYNTDLDPGETTNLSETEQGQVLWMVREMTAELAAARKARASAPVEKWSDDVRQRLKQLGYVD